MVVIAAGRDEGGAGPAGGQRESQHAAIEVERALQVGDLEVDVADLTPSSMVGKASACFSRVSGLVIGASLR